MSIAYSHHHLHVANLDAHRRFWIDGLGGTAADSLGGTETIRMSGALVLLDAKPNTGGTKGTTLNHIGFQVRIFARRFVGSRLPVSRW